MDTHARRWRVLAVLTAVVAVVVMTVAPAGGQDSQRTKGRFSTLSGGADLGYEIDGRAVMWRENGMTRVEVLVRGLDANTTYPAHVHAEPCRATPPGGPHYQHVVGGPVDPVNEIWPIVVSDEGGIGMGEATHDHVARREARSVIIHYPPDTSIRLACADLRS